MPPKKRKENHLEITQADCPAQIVPKYPGVYHRNNPDGSSLSKHEFIEHAVRQWVEHFNGSEKYENTSLANKARYLVPHLIHHKTQRFSIKHIREMLVRAEISVGVLKDKSLESIYVIC